jgi:hypothetical protein
MIKVLEELIDEWYFWCEVSFRCLGHCFAIEEASYYEDQIMKIDPDFFNLKKGDSNALNSKIDTSR